IGIRVIEDQITTLRTYNARYTGDHRSSFRKRYAEMITRISLDLSVHKSRNGSLCVMDVYLSREVPTWLAAQADVRAWVQSGSGSASSSQAGGMPASPVRAATTPAVIAQVVSMSPSPSAVVQSAPGRSS